MSALKRTILVLLALASIVVTFYAATNAWPAWAFGLSLTSMIVLIHVAAYWPFGEAQR